MLHPNLFMCSLRHVDLDFAAQYPGIPALLTVATNLPYHEESNVSRSRLRNTSIDHQMSISWGPDTAPVCKATRRRWDYYPSASHTPWPYLH